MSGPTRAALPTTPTQIKRSSLPKTVGTMVTSVLAIAVLSLLSMTLVSPRLVSSASMEKLQVSTASVTPGSTIQITGRGFRAGQRGFVMLEDAPRAKVAFHANTRGRFSISFRIASTTQLGDHRLVARAAGDGKLLGSVRIKVHGRWAGGASPAPVASGSTPTDPLPTDAPTGSGQPTDPGATEAPPAPTDTPPAPTDPPPAPTPPPSAGALRWGLIGNDGAHLAAERAAGINTKLLELGWSSYEPGRGVFSAGYISAKRAELAALKAAGFQVILSFGVQYSPSWLLDLPDSRYVNQYGDAYADTTHGSGQANVVWNPTIRSEMARYMARVFNDLGTSFDAVRIGGGRFGELGYPVATYNGRSNTYWAFDANADNSNPVPGWKPGMASPNGEAGKFLEWYLDKLDEYEGWQIARVREGYDGRIIVLNPSFGIRPGQAATAVSHNLDGSTSPEINGEIQRGYDYARFVGSITDHKTLIASTWLNCTYGDDSAADPGRGTPIKYLAYLAGRQGLRAYGENTGRDGLADLRFSNAQAIRYGLVGFVWFNEKEMLSGSYASLDDYAAVIRATN